VTIIKVGKYIFGGYATESWDGEVYNSFSYQVFKRFDQEKCQSRWLKITRCVGMPACRCIKIGNTFLNGACPN
jgi:hypothetical protein